METLRALPDNPNDWANPPSGTFNALYARAYRFFALTYFSNKIEEGDN